MLTISLADGAAWQTPRVRQRMQILPRIPEISWQCPSYLKAPPFSQPPVSLQLQTVLVELEWDVFGLLRRQGFGVTCLPAGESEPCGFN